MKTLIRLVSVSSLILAGLAVVPASAGAQPQEETPTGTAALAMHADKEKGFDEAIEAARLRPDQKAEVDKLRSEWRDRHAPAKRAHQELMLALADQIEKGEIDRCKLSGQLQKAAAEMAKTKAGDRASMEKLHSILDPEQRARYADSLKEFIARMRREHTPEALAGKIDKKLGLKEDQKKRLHEVLAGLHQIREANPEHAERRARMTKILDAFKGEQFKLDDVAPLPKDLEKRMMKRMQAHIWGQEAVMPLFDEQQRAKVAGMFRDKAKGHEESEEGKPEQGKHEQGAPKSTTDAYEDADE